MTVLVDTTIWSLALRRPSHRLSAVQQRLIAEWCRLVEDGEAALLGLIRQEILSGVRDRDVFDSLRDRLAGIDCLSIGLDDYDEAARFYDELRSRGVAGGTVDLLLCAVACRRGCPIFTTDHDFVRYAQHLPLQLHRVPSGR